MSPDLVVLSHLRWTFVWQRPQHLVSRLALEHRRTWFVEEPLPVEGLDEPALRTEDHGPVTRVWLEVPAAGRSHVPFDEAACERYATELQRLLGAAAAPVVWLYTPMALDLARALRPTTLVYDVMDDLAAFRYAPPGLVLRQRLALREADLVFTGGRSLHRGVAEHRSEALHCFPSGVEPEHYAHAVHHRAARSGGHRVAGYVGVVDERLDLDLLGGLAEALHDWEVRVVGPVIKIDERDLPKAPNLTYPGPAPYASLPEVMGSFDVALMPFALNEATRSISPTKTLEYLAAGLPVVSTRVPDVVADHAGVVDLCDDAEGFAAACRRAVGSIDLQRSARVGPLLQQQSWDAIADRMASHLRLAAATSSPDALETA